ncbi:V-type ATP synthase subunit F [Anaerococcus sp. NML200574]|uniref:V-type ATP synthase subunit F n=1 Tax=unclassified Anaerococcus TaxID=2614126 RepID=UPI000D0B4F4E|nr:MULTISPECIES: V-type ATP synthase subunit F [unclassified Anaerococcus]MCW6677855.1 V-type ATP synthase subunit F [Anaerococcus sp. NML200574]MCW6701624.1 V-type ATP synthase subunit F [Anaerococcus sp. NML200537]
MKAKILTDSNNLLTMFRLGAIEASLVDENNFEEEFRNSYKDENLAILIITRSVYNKNNNRIDNYRRDYTMPLIVIIDG